MDSDRLDDAELAAKALTVDPTRSTIVLMFGTKGTGKSAAARALFDSWPADRIVIDPSGDARPDDPATKVYTAPFDSQLPDPDQDAEPPQQRVTVWARLSRRSPTFTADQDGAMSMALYPRHRHKFVWRDEFALGTSAYTTTPADEDLMISSRHYNASGVFCCPRPRNIPKMAIQQADQVLMWNVPDPDDREYVAKNFGITVPVLEREYHDNRRRSKHAFLLLDRAQDALLNCPPLPGIVARGPKS